MARNEEGFTLIELLVVATIIGVLSAAALGFHAAARQRTADIAAKANIDAAVPAMNA
jgi:prepilin-type N-terminal cleavage/methylation domain-containing protein